MIEADLQNGVIELARLLGYRVAHFRPALTTKGWRTPVEADGKGFPDLVLARPGRLIFAELKGDTGRPTLEQGEWLSALAAAGAELYVWRPHHWRDGQIERQLRAPTRPEQPT